MADTPKYSKYVDSIDVDAFEEAIGFSPTHQDGDEDQGFCLFPENHAHGDTTGKFSINREKRVYGCWLCGGGSLLSLAMEVLDLDEEDANDWVYQFADPTSDLDDSDLEAEVAAIIDAEPERPSPLPYFNSRVLDRLPPGHGPWNDERGISESISDLFDLRVNKEARTRNRDTGETYVGPGLIIPHYVAGRLVGWQTRWLDDDLPDWVRKRKYVNTLDFPRERTLYGLDLARDQDLDHPFYVVESTRTALFLWSAGLPATATFGADVKEEQLRLLRGFQAGVAFGPDNDQAGRWWVNGRYSGQGRKLRAPLAEYLEDYVPVWVVDPPRHREGADLGDLVGPFGDRYGRLFDHLEANTLDA